jgi:DNA primase
MSIQEIKEANDIVDVISRYMELKGRGSRLLGLCPLHIEKHPSFTIYLEQQRWKCFGCGRNGDIIDFIEEAEKVDTAGAIAILAGSGT